LPLPCQDQNVTIRVAAVGAAGGGGWRPSTVRVYRIDKDHANPAETWTAMGSPEYLLWAIT
jgi:hypothetical protein